MKCWTRKFYDSKVQWNRCTLLNAAINRDYITVHAVFVTFCTCWSSPSSKPSHTFSRTRTQFLHRSDSLTFSINNKNAHISTEASSDPQSTNSSSLIIVILLDFCFFPWKDSDRSIFVRGTYAIASSSHSLLFYFYFVCWCDLFLRRDRTNRDREREKLRTR